MGNHSHEMAGKLCIVTGGNTGIGKETARALAGLGATVVLACRDLAKAQAARKEIWASVPDAQIEVMRLDLGDTSQIDVFASAFAERHQRLDVLINNAGVSTRRRTTTKDGFETVFGVNHVGPARLTLKLLDVLKKSAPSRVIFVASNYHFQGHME